MGIDIYTLALDYPDTIIQVKASDLVEAARVFVEDLEPEPNAKQEEEPNQRNHRDRTSENPSGPKREVMKLLGVVKPRYGGGHTIMITCTQ